MLSITGELLGIYPNSPIFEAQFRQYRHLVLMMLPYCCFIIFDWLFDKVGAFDEQLSVARQDTDYILRCKNVRIEPYYDSNLGVNHLARMSLDDLRHGIGTPFSEEFEKLLKISEAHFLNKWGDI